VKDKKTRRPLPAAAPEQNERPLYA